MVDKLSDALEEMRRAADELTAAIDRDSRLYDAVLAAFKMPQGDGEEIKSARCGDSGGHARGDGSAAGSGRRVQLHFSNVWDNLQLSPPHP